jgi:hypothetical protein
MAAKTRRAYKGGAVATTITADFNAGAASTTIAAYTGWPYGSDPFYVVLQPGTANEEKVLVTRAGSTDTTLNVVSGGRGADDTSDVNHASGSAIYPVFTAVDADEANELASTLTSKGDLLSMNSGPSFTRLAVGTDDYVLVADNAESTGLKWAQVSSAGVADGAITEVKIGSAAVTESKIGSAAVTEAKIGAAAVTESKIGSAAVTNAKIGTGAVDTAQLADDAVTNAKIGAAAVDTTELAASAVTTAKIDDGAVTEVKIAAAAKDTQYHTEAQAATVSSITNSGTPGGGNTLVSQTITPAYAGIALVTGTFDFECTTFTSASAAIGELEVGGSTQSAQAIFIPSAAGQRVTVSQTWIVPVTTSSTLFVLSARRDSTSVVIRAAQDHTTMNVVFLRS